MVTGCGGDGCGSNIRGCLWVMGCVVEVNSIPVATGRGVATIMVVHG